MAHRTDADIIEKTHNTARFFVEHQHIAWVLLIGTVLWGWYGYNSMPQRKDPDIPVRVAVALTPWPGVKAQEVEQLVTRPIEEKIAENSYIHPATAADYGIRSITLPGLSIIYVQLAENVTDTKKQFSDINLKLNALNNQLPQGAGPIQFQSDFGDTAALMLTVASPRLDEVEIAIRARSVQKAIEEARRSKLSKSPDPRVGAVYCFPQSVSPDAVRRGFDSFSQLAQQDGVFRDVRLFAGPGYIGLDGSSARSDPEIQSYSATVRLEIDPDRANLAGVTNSDVASSTTAALSGTTVTTLREGQKQIPVVARLRMEERAQLSDIQNLYIYSAQSTQKLPLVQISSIKNDLESQRIRRQEHFRTISVECAPAAGALSSEILNAAMPKLLAFQASLPPGYKMIIGGENAKQVEGFRNLAVVMGISVAAIFLALVLQFNHAVKPLLVFAAVPYGIVGAILALFITGTPFGFMAFLGIASLIGVIVSHVIVLFDFIEEMHEKGEPLERALVDAGIVRLRPVLITVGATVLALFPLALHGGPLWKPLCYSQIGGLGVATFITLLLVPVFYSIFVLDLKLVKWEGSAE